MSTRVAIAFDIDGVFKYGREWSKDGTRALQKVVDADMPFCFITNGGGGLTEAAYAGSMTTKIAGASKSSAPIVIGPERIPGRRSFMGFMLNTLADTGEIVFDMSLD